MLHVDIKKRLEANGLVSLSLDVAFTAPEGITVLFGPSGSGKTTVLRIIAGITAPDKGEVTLGDRVYFDSTIGINLTMQERKVGFVFQDYALFPHLTAEQNVAYGVAGAGASLRRQRAREMLALFRIEHASGRYPGELSGGEQQRVAFARALASNPSILLLDEPLSAVDFTTRSRLLDEIDSVQRQSRIPLIYVTHSQAEAVRLGNQIVVLHEGRAVRQGRPLEVLNSPDSAAVARAVGTENVFMGRIVEHRSAEGVTTIDLDGCQVEATYNGLSIGSRVTVGLRSEDILVSRELITQTSARNILEGVVKRIVLDADTTELVVGCGVDFKVSVTAAAIEALRLKPGVKVYLLIKARAFHLLA